MKKIIALILCILMLSSVLLACKGNENPDASSGDGTENEVQNIDPTSTIAAAQADNPVVDYLQLGGEQANIYCEMNKDPYDYTAGEDMVFTISLLSHGKNISCGGFKVVLHRDGIEGEWAAKSSTEENTFTVDGSTGKFTFTTRMTQPGFATINVVALDKDGKALAETKAERLEAGACADIEKLTYTKEAPADFDEYWSEAIKDLNKINPDILLFEKNSKSSESNKYDFYDVKIKAVDDAPYFEGIGENPVKEHDFVAGTIAVPKNASPKSCKIAMIFDGHGVSEASNPTMYLDGKTIVFHVIAHSLEPNGSKNYFNRQSALLSGYGMNYANESNPDNVYYRNMILRNLQALRFLAEYYGAGGGGTNLWNGKDVIVNGRSQGGFQALAVAGLSEKIGVSVTKAEISAPWLCDIVPDKNDTIQSHWWPSGKYETLAYFDSALFAKSIKCELELEISLGDVTTPGTGIMKMYNNLATSNKKLEFVQGKGHGSETLFSKSFTYK